MTICEAVLTAILTKEQIEAGLYLKDENEIITLYHDWRALACFNREVTVDNIQAEIHKQYCKITSGYQLWREVNGRTKAESETSGVGGIQAATKG